MERQCSWRELVLFIYLALGLAVALSTSIASANTSKRIIRDNATMQEATEVAKPTVKLQTVVEMREAVIATKEVDGMSNIEDREKENCKNDINIDEAIFGEVSTRLNTEIYEEAEAVINDDHLMEFEGDSRLFKSYKDTLTPLVPLALSINETGTWMSTKYTWTPAIYSRLLAEAGVDLSRT